MDGPEFNKARAALDEEMKTSRKEGVVTKFEGV